MTDTWRVKRCIIIIITLCETNIKAFDEEMLIPHFVLPDNDEAIVDEVDKCNVM